MINDLWSGRYLLSMLIGDGACPIQNKLREDTSKGLYI